MTTMQDILRAQEPPFFTGLRRNEWTPRFHWDPSLDSVAEAINGPHEDYPARIPATKDAILQLLPTLEDPVRITLSTLRQIHRTVFPDHGERAGQWRTINVQVADHIAPRWEWIDKLMEELEQRYWDTELSPENLRHWAYDFNTIHPLRDGNGRTAGIMIAAISFHTHGIYLAPGQ